MPPENLEELYQQAGAGETPDEITQEPVAVEPEDKPVRDEAADLRRELEDAKREAVEAVRARDGILGDARAERERRREEERRYEERLLQLQQRMDQFSAPKPEPVKDDDPKPDESDVVATLQWQIRQERKRSDTRFGEQEKTLSELKREKEANALLLQVSNAVKVRELQYAEQNPDYWDALTYLSKKIEDQIKAMYPYATPEQVNAERERQVLGAAHGNLVNRTDPAASAYNWALAVGYVKPGSTATEARQAQAVAAQAVQAAEATAAPTELPAASLPPSRAAAAKSLSNLSGRSGAQMGMSELLRAKVRSSDFSKLVSGMKTTEGMSRLKEIMERS